MEGYENVPESFSSTTFVSSQAQQAVTAAVSPRPQNRRPAKYYHPTDENGSSLFLASSSDVYEAEENSGTRKSSVFGYDVAPPLSYDQDENQASLSVAAALAQSKDWNKEFQSLLEEPDTESKFTRLRHLGNDFVYVATAGAKIIISELHSERKTIPPVNIGGRAGGDKYVYRNILFKFAMDVELDENRGWMYGGFRPSHERAMKAAANELRGLMHYASLHLKELHFPMMVLIDYKGFRMIAQSVLPISKDTLRYGCSDGGETVLASLDTLNQIMETVGKRLHLAAHEVNGKTLYGPGDQEVHLGTDGRFYCIDLGRVFPCEAPPRPGLRPDLTLDPRAVFYNLLRPEYLLSYGTPLVSDAYSGWGKLDPRFKSHNAAVYEATQQLFRVVVPKFAKDLDDIDRAHIQPKESMWSMWKSIDLVATLHRAGLNVRHLGKVRSVVASSRMKALLLNEMVARTLKNMIRAQLRSLMENIRYLSSEQVRECVASVFTSILRATRHETSSPLVAESPPTPTLSTSRSQLLLSSSTSSSTSTSDNSTAQSGIFDQSFKEVMCVKFRDCLTAGERQGSFDLASALDVELIFLRLQEMLSITLSEDAQRELESPNFEFIYCDILSVNPKVRFMNILDEAEGMSLLMTALRNPQTKRSRLLKLAASKFEQASRTFPNNYTALFHWARSVYYQARLIEEISYQRSQLFSLLSDATLKLEGVLQLHEKHVDANRWLIKVLLHRVNAEASVPVIKQLCSAISRGLLLVSAEYTEFPAWTQRKLQLIFSKYSRACENEELLSNIAGLFSSLHNSLLSAVEKHEKLLNSANVLEASAAKATHTRLSWIQAKNLLVWGRCLTMLAELNSSLGGESNPPKSPTSLSSSNSSSSNLKPWMQGVQKLNGKLMRFQAADRFSELLGIQDARVAELILDELHVIADLAENSYTLKCRLEAVASSLQQFCFRRFLQSRRITQRPAAAEAVSSVGLFTRLGPCMANLTELDISSCPIRLSSVLDCLPHLTTLQILNASNLQPPLDDSQVSVISKLVNLTSLDVHGSSVSAESMTPLLKSIGSRLSHLNIGKTKLDMNFLLNLSQLCPNLRYLNLNYLFNDVNQVDRVERRSFPAPWPSLMIPTCLTEIHLMDGLGVSNTLTEYIAGHVTGLQDLRLGAKKITDPGLLPLASIAPNLRVLHLRGLNTSEVAFKAILSNLGPHLVDLSLVACMGLTDSALSSIPARTGPSIRNLDLSSCQSIAGHSLDELCQKGLTNLVDLDVSFLSTCERHSLVKFISSQHSLVKLIINNTHKLDSDVAISEMISNLELLEEFSAESFEHLGAKTVKALSKHCPSLVLLNLSDCSGIRNPILKPLSRAKTLKHLKLKHCRYVTKDIIESLSQSLLLETVVL